MTTVKEQDIEVALDTITGIEIANVGEEWPAATGPFTLTQDHIASVIASQEDPAIKSPRVKLGHDSILTPDVPGSVFGGKPVFGKFTNLRATNNGTTLVGDITGIPKWAKEVLPYAWPSRSGEWLADWDNFGTAKTRWPMVLSAVALLGVELPGITTIEDLPAYFTADGPKDVKVVIDGALIRAHSKEETTTTHSRKSGNVVITSVDSADVRSSFFNDFAPIGGERQWWWPTQVFINPTAVIAEDEDTGDLYYCPYNVSGDAIEWDDPTEAKHQYVSAEDGSTVLAGRSDPVEQYRSAAAVRPSDRKKSTTKEDPTVKVRTDGIDIPALRAKIGVDESVLPDDATEEQINAALAADPPESTESTESTDEPETVPAATTKRGVTQREDGTVVLDAEAWEQHQSDLKRLVEKDTTSEKKRREKVVTDAITARKIPPARKEHYTALMEKDPEGTEDLLNSLEKDAVPGAPIGTDRETTQRKRTEGTGLFPNLDAQRKSREEATA